MVADKSESVCYAKVETIRLRRHNSRTEEVLRSVPAAETKARIPQPAASGLSEEIRNQKVVQMLPLLHRIAKKMRVHLPPQVEVDDLVGAGAIGLIDAVQKFDASRNVKFESYAQHRIRGAMIDGLREMDTAPQSIRRKSKKAAATHRELEGKLCRPATDEEFASAQGVSLKEWYKTLHEMQALGVGWLRPTDESSTLHFIEETIPSNDEHDQFDMCYLREKREILNRALVALPTRERRILMLYYVHHLTMKQIAAELKVDESRVSQLHSATLLRLRTTVTLQLRAPRHSTVLANNNRNLAA